VLLPGERPLPGVVVTAHLLDGNAPPAAPLQAVMDQVSLRFSPDLLVIPVGSTVIFPNTDTVSHEVYSFSPAHPFQLPLYRGKPYPPEHFTRAGLVTLGCNIHDDMLAYILVTDAQYFGITDAQGQWRQKDLARGHYRIDIWGPRLRESAEALQREVVVGAEPAQVSIPLLHALRPAPLQKRPHSWDAY
jgi:plastocyanin